jgi:hypothetical protein
MKDLLEPIAAALVDSSNIEGVIFAKKDKIDNLMQLMFEQRITIEKIDTAVKNNAKPDDIKKLFTFIANNLLKYLSERLKKSRFTGTRAAPSIQKIEESKRKLSKSEQFLERKRREALQKADDANAPKEGTVTKVGLKEIGKEMKEHEEMMKTLDAKREEQQKTTEEERQKHIAAYQFAFLLFAHTVKITNPDTNTAELCELITHIGYAEIPRRQSALDKIARNPQSMFAFDALIAGLHDKNIIIQIINVLQNVSERKGIIPLINLIKEYSTPNDIIFRGPSEKAIGNIVQAMNKKDKNAGTKYIYQLCSNPKFEPLLYFLARTLIRDINNSQYAEEYFTPDCFKWMALIAEKIAESKKKMVKVGFFNMTRPTELSKLLSEFAETAKACTQK